MEKSQGTNSSLDTSRSKDESGLLLSPHRSRRLEEKAKALNKPHLSLEDLLGSIDKRNEKFGYVNTHSKSLHLSDFDAKTCKKVIIHPCSSSHSEYEQCKSLSNLEKVYSSEENCRLDPLSKRCSGRRGKYHESRLVGDKNLLAESSESMKGINKTLERKETVLGSLHRTKSCTTLHETQSLYSSCNTSMTVKCKDVITILDDDADVNKIEKPSVTYKHTNSMPNRVKDHSSLSLGNEGLQRNSTSDVSKTTSGVNHEFQSKMSHSIDKKKSLSIQNHEQCKSDVEGKSIYQIVDQYKAKDFAKGRDRPLLIKHRKCSNEANSSDDDVVVEERFNQGPQEIFLHHGYKLVARNVPDISVLKRHAKNSAALLPSQSSIRNEQTVCPEEGKIVSSRLVLNKSESTLKFSSSKCSLGPSSFPANSTEKFTVLNEIATGITVSTNDSAINNISEENVASATQVHIVGENEHSLVGFEGVMKEGKEKNSSPKRRKKHLSSESPEVHLLRIVRSTSNESSTDCRNDEKNGLGENRNNHIKQEIPNATVRNLFHEEEQLMVFTKKLMVQNLNQDKSSNYGHDHCSNEELDAVAKSSSETEEDSHSSPKKLEVIKSSDDEKPTNSASIDRNRIPLKFSSQEIKESFVFDADEDLEKFEDDILERQRKGDYSCGFTGFEDDHRNLQPKWQPSVALERLPSWIVKNQTVKLTNGTFLSEKTVQEFDDSRISLEELLNRKGDLQLKRKYKSMSDLSDLIHLDLMKEKEFMIDRRRVTRSLGEQIKVDYLAKLPDERDIKFKKPENDFPSFCGFNIPFGFLGLPDHYLVYRSIFNRCKQLGYPIDPISGVEDLIESCASIYFMGDYNPFRPRPSISQAERDKISPTKILEIASCNNKISSQYPTSSQGRSSLLSSPEKVEEMENLNFELDQGPLSDSLNLSMRPNLRTKPHSPSNISNSDLNPNATNSVHDSCLNNTTENYMTKCEPVGSACGKDFCRLGCICESLKVRIRRKEHCGHEGCMFSNVCYKSVSKPCSRKVKMSILENIVKSSAEEEMVRSKRKRKLPARLLEEEIICNPLIVGGKKLSGNTSSSTVEKPVKIAKCYVVLNRFQLSGTQVRCLYHFRLNCPCLKDKSLEKPRNVALKSTSGRLKLNLQISSNYSLLPPDGSKIYLPMAEPEYITPKEEPMKSTLNNLGMDKCQLNTSYPQNCTKLNESNLSSSTIFNSADFQECREDSNMGGPQSSIFNNVFEFQSALSEGSMKCSDLENICSLSLSYLPKGAVQIMKLSTLKEMLEKKLAYLWVMHLRSGKSNIFVTKEYKAPGVACQRVRELDDLSRVPSLSWSLFTDYKKKDFFISCILVSQSYFWQITGTISFRRSNASCSSKTGTVVTNISDGKPLWTTSMHSNTTHTGVKHNHFISLESGNFRVTSGSNSVKVTKKAVHGRVNLFNNLPVSKTSPPRGSAESLLLTGLQDRHRIWYSLNLDKPFDLLRVKECDFRITRSKLRQLYKLAHDRKQFVRVLFASNSPPDSKNHPGILVNPNETSFSVKLGPFPALAATGVKTYKFSYGFSVETVPFLTIDKIISVESSLQQKHEPEVAVPIVAEENVVEESRVTECNEVMNPRISDIVSTKDADPGLKIVIQDVQGHYNSFNDIPSPKRSTPFENEDLTESWQNGSADSYAGECIENESEVKSDESHSFSTACSPRIETNISSGCVASVQECNSGLPENANPSSAADSGVVAFKDNLSSDYFDIPSEIVSNDKELIVKEEPKSDPLDESDHLPYTSEDIPDSSEMKDHVLGPDSITDIGNVSNVFKLKPYSFLKSKHLKEKSKLLGEPKERKNTTLKRSLLKRNILPPKTTKLTKSSTAPDVTTNNIETGYLIPDIPGILPIPVARGGMTILESKALTMKNPFSKEGKLVHILDLRLANLFLNEAIVQRINLFPSDLKINWTFVKVDGITRKNDFDGLVNLGDITSSMFITSKGVFSYDEVRSKSMFKKCGISLESMHKFMEKRRRMEIITTCKQLSDLIQDGKKEKKSLASTIREARNEIKKLESEFEELESMMFKEVQAKTYLMSRLRKVASAEEMKTITNSLRPLKRENELVSMESIGENSTDNSRLGDSSWIQNVTTKSQTRGKSNRCRKRISEEGLDRNWTPEGLKKKKRVRKGENKAGELKETLSLGKNELPSKAVAITGTIFESEFQDQLQLLKRHIISGNNYRSKGKGLSGRTSKYAILNSAKSVLAETCSSLLENEDSTLGSGSDIDVEGLEDDLKVNS